MSWQPVWGCHGHEEEFQDSRTDSHHWSVRAEEVESRGREHAHWFTGSDDVFVAGNVSDEQSPEVSTVLCSAVSTLMAYSDRA